METPAPHAVPLDNWFVMVDASWQETAPDAAPPPELILGGWHVDEDGNQGPFEPNPDYVPSDDSSPTDPTDAVLQRAINGDDVGGDIIPTLFDALVEIAGNDRGELLVGAAPDGVRCVCVVTAAVHKRRIEAERWIQILGSELAKIVPDGVDILLNPNSREQFRLHTGALRKPE
ncbi:type VII secretion system-associated protein [Nocardia sp. NPDC057440]|uniref:type VII secretion system-associated protein n=1 Tax=Nocardia sp. NPDC057440 TaxID=3346134 RepID=UPI003672051B